MRFEFLVRFSIALLLRSFWSGFPYFFCLEFYVNDFISRETVAHVAPTLSPPFSLLAFSLLLFILPARRFLFQL